jgi:hypothetical protein
MEVDVGIELLAVKRIDRRGVLSADVPEAEVFANHGAVLGFHESVVAGTVGSRLGLLD